MRTLITLIAFWSFCGSTMTGFSQIQEKALLRQEASTLQKQGNFRDAFERYQKLLENPGDDPALSAQDLDQGVACLYRLQQITELDSLLNSATKIHSENWRLLRNAAIHLGRAPHHGVVQGKAFLRNSNGNQGGVFVNRNEEDRRKALQWLHQAIPFVEKEKAGKETADFYLQLARILLENRSDRFAWRLLEPTDLVTPPDYADLDSSWLPTIRFASVDEKGNPIFFKIPKAWSDAGSDGERLRWALEQTTEMDPSKGIEAKMLWANFLQTQFSVDTLQENYWMFGGVRSHSDVKSEDKQPEAGIFSIHTLSEEEAIAKLANGIKRFHLPSDQNPIKIYQEIAKQKSTYAKDALIALGNIHLNRRQYPKAVEYFRQFELIVDRTQSLRQQIDSIVLARGTFDAIPTQLAGRAAEISMVFRNAKKVDFVAHQVDLELLAAETKRFFETTVIGSTQGFAGRPNAGPPSFASPAELFQNLQVGKYAPKQVASWQLPLEPRENHWDRRIELETPLKKAGLYVVTASFDGGVHHARTLLWIQDTVIIRKAIDNQVLYYVADAESGQPLPGMNVELLGIQPNPDPKRGGKSFFTTNFARRTDRQGKLTLSAKDVAAANQWIAIARDGKGRLATLGMEYLGVQPMHSDVFDQLKAYGVSDRPAYRPGDTIHAKVWIARSTFAPDIPSVPLAKDSFLLKCIDPEGTAILEKEFTTDSFGGAEFDIPTTKQAKLGLYSVQVMPKAQPNHWIDCPLRMRIEEYRKPEFEVQVSAPTKPVALGETIRATIRAKYYFGSPVTEATATIRVQRSSYVDHYFPVAPFDWCFGPGYWWFGYDYPWYPGWNRWRSCSRPAPWWLGFQGSEPPELVLEQEIKLDASGEAKIEIDTATAKAFQANQDHQYSISVEVRDASRRTIDASGMVIAARQPFKIYSWLDRGFYRIGDKILANFQARTPSGDAVSAKGKLDLLRISYDADRQPQERVEQTWEVATNEEGVLEHLLQAKSSGQYRLRLQLTDEAGHEIEGAYLFTVRGDRDRGGDFRFSGLELIPDRQHYQPNDKVRLQINADRDDATVLLFVRPQSGVAPLPQFISLEGKTKTIEIQVASADQPNFFVEALTIYEGEVHRAIREILVPPEKRILQVTSKLDKKEYLPGEEATIDLDVVDSQGNRKETSAVIAVYDRSLEAIAPDALPSDIREFFWKWRRSYFGEEIDNLQWLSFASIIRGVVPWTPLGIFGDSLADDAKQFDGKPKAGAPRPRSNRLARGRFGGAPGGMGGMGGMGGAMMMDAMPMSAPMPAEGAEMSVAAMAGGMAGGGGGGGFGQGNAASMVPPPKVRKDFADTAYWVGRIQTDAQGKASVKFKMPENLTSWKIRTWAMGSSVRVGSSAIDTVTRKNLLVRLQAPRFLVERDRCVISSIVNNDLPSDVDVLVRLEVDGEMNLRLAEGETPEKRIRIESKGQKRIDWKCLALAEGEVILRTIAASSVESDAMQIKLPIVVNGILKTDSFAGTVRPDQPSSTVALQIPESRRVEQSRLIVRLSPSLASSMIDALPYMTDYPYGCTEQTLNRFLPTVITQRILQEMNIDLAKLANRRNNLNAQELGNPSDRTKQWKRLGRNPVYDVQEVQAMVEEGLNRLTSMQCSDGGWGWFSGFGEHSWPHTTAVVVRGLRVAQQNDVAIVPGVLEKGIAWLENYQNEQLQLLKNGATQTKPFKTSPDPADALVFSILMDCGRSNAEMQTLLYEKRDALSVYGLSLLALGTHLSGNVEQTTMLRRNIEQFLVEDAENETAFLRNGSPWWYWHGSEIETAATYLKLLSKIDAKGRIAPRIVKYLLNNRKHATYWSSTRDTALVIEAFGEYLRASGEASGNMTATVLLDGARLGSVTFTPSTLFEVENTITLEGQAIPAGQHKLEIRRDGEGPLYWNAFSTNFTLEEEIPAAGLEIKVDRKYYLITPVKKDLTLAGDRGQIVEAERAAFERTELQDLTEVKSGSTIEVELFVESKNDYEYLLLEDKKPATLEPIDLQSGYAYQHGLAIYREFRDQKVSFFMRTLPQGKHSIRYRMRAEAPGTFTALPAVVGGMYAPELVGNSVDHDFATIDR